MVSRKSARLSRVATSTRLAAEARTARRALARDAVSASARVTAELMEQRVLLTGTPVLGVNFATTRAVGTDATLASTDSAGLVAMSHWNNAISANEGPTTGTLTGLTDSTGAATTAGVSWQSNGTWDNANGATTNNFTGADKTLMTGYIWYNGTPNDTNAADKVATTASLSSGTLDGNGVLFTGLTGSAYDVVVYSLSDGGGQGGVTTVTGTNTSAIGIHDAASSSYILGKNYMLFLNMHPQGGDLLITPDGVTARNNYNAIELLNPSTVAPAAPTGAAVTQGANGSANLTWTAAAPQGDEYLVQRSASAGGTFTTIATLDKSITAYNDANPPVGQNFYKVVAANSAGQAASAVVGPVTTPPAPAPILGVHFGSDYGGGSVLAPTDTAGVFPMSNWNNEAAATGSATGLTNASGTATGVGVSWKTNDVWGAGGNDNFTGGDNKLMNGYLDNAGGTAAATAASLTSGTLDGNGALLTGLTGTSYDVVVYSLGDGAGRSGLINVTGMNTASGPNLTEPSSTYIRGQNYELFFGIHPLNGSLLITPRSSDYRNPINGIELLPSFATAAPAAPTNLTATVSGASVNLNWNENGTSAQQFLVERATNAGFTTGVTTLATLDPSSGNTGTYTDSSLQVGVQYWYRIGAVNDFNGGTEVDSNIAGPVVLAATNSTNPIGLNFASGNGAEFDLAPTDVAGAYPIPHWNNETLVNPAVQANGAMNTANAITDSTGIVTAVNATWFANNPWSSGGNDNFPAGPDHSLMEGYLDEWGFGANGGSNHHSATAATLTSGTLDGQGILLTNLNLSTYDLIIYSLGDGAGRIGTFTAIGSNSVSARNESEPSTTYVLGQNTAVLAGVKPINGMLLITYDDTTVRDPINGIELLPIATAAPTAVVLSGTYDPVNAAVNLTWTGGGNNTLENLIQRSTSPTGPWTTVGAALPNATSFTDNIPLAGQPFYYRVTASNSFNGGSTAPSNVVGPFSAPAGSGAEARFFPSAFWSGQPTITQNVTTVNLNIPGGTIDPSIRTTNSSVIFTGQIKANEGGVYTFVSNNGDDGYLYVDGVLVSSDFGAHGRRNAPATSIFPISLAANSTNNFVYLVNHGSNADAAELQWVTPSMALANPTAAPVLVPNTNLIAAIGTPTKPTALAVSGTPGSNSVDFIFTSDNNAVVHYQLQRSDDGGTNWVTVSQTNPSNAFQGSPNPNIPIEDATANPGKTYQYRVIAMNFDHSSTASDPVTVSTAAATQGPGVELRYYNGQIASQTYGLAAQNFATAGLPTEFLSLDGSSASQSYSGSPDPTPYLDLLRVNRYSYATVWTGQIVTDQAGAYTFVGNTSDDGYLFVNGTLVSSDPGTHAARDASTLTPLTLAANTAYNFVFIEQEVNNGISGTAQAAAHLEWIEPGQTTPAIIPPAGTGTGGLQKLMSTPDKQTIDATGHITETAGQSAAGTLAATGATSGSGVTLTWTDQSLSELWFEVQRSTSATGPFTTVGTVGMNGTSFTDSSAVVGTHYFYRVRGMNFDAAGPFSNTADAVATSASQTINGTAGNDTITLKVDGTDPTKDDVWINVATTGTPTEQVSNGSTIVINGLGGNDTLVLDSTNGNPIPTGANSVLRLNGDAGTFTIGGSLPTLDATHVVDVGISTVNIPYTGTSILPAVQSALKNGFIKSSDAAASSGKFGVADTDTGTQITLKYLVIGDLNGDGSVNFNDLLALAQHYGNTGADWAKGDLNYDGTVNFNDLLALAQHYGQTAAITAASLSSAASSSSLDLLASSRKAKASVRKH